MDRIHFMTCKRCNCFMFPENYEIGYCGICQIKNKEDEETQHRNLEREPIIAEIYEFIRTTFPDKVNEIEIRWKENND